MKETTPIFVRICCACNGQSRLEQRAKAERVSNMLASIYGLRAKTFFVADLEKLSKVLRSRECDLLIADESIVTEIQEIPDFDLPVLFLVSELKPVELIKTLQSRGLEERDSFVIASWDSEEWLEKALRRSIRNALAWNLSYRMRYERLLSTTLAKFVTSEHEQRDVDSLIRNALSVIGNFFRVDRAYIWRFNPLGRSMQKSYNWSAEGVQIRFEVGEEIPVTLYPWVVERIQDGTVLNISSLSALPNEAERDRNVFESVNTKSFLAIPLTFRGRSIGFLGVSAVGKERNWDEETVSLLTTVGGIFVSVFQKQNAEFALKTSEEKFGAVVEHLGDGLAIVDSEQRILYANSRFGSFCDSSQSGVEGRFFREIFGNRASELLQESMGEALGGVKRFELESDAEKLCFELKSSFFEKSSDQTIVTISDITARRLLEQELFHSQKMEAVGRLAGGVAHDFNNLLTAVLGYSGLLLHRMPEASPYRSELLQIRKASEQAGSLVEQLLAFSRKQVLVPKVVNLNEVIEDTTKLLRRLIGEDIELRLGLEQTISNVKIDPAQMQQIIINLAINARDAMPDGGTISIATVTKELKELGPISELAGVSQSKEHFVSLSVSDTGTGIDENIVKRIFEPFFTTKELGKGTGLGLSTVYGAVKQSGGEITVQSEPGVGTTFEIVIPTCHDTCSRAVASNINLEIAEGNETILVVEDEDSVRALLKEVLEDRGHRIIEAANGQEALEKERRFFGKIDLMITDVVMPKMGGHELAELIRPRRPGMKILIISGYLRGKGIPKSSYGNDFTFLQKPFTPDDFARIVREVLDSEGDTSNYQTIDVSESLSKPN